MGPDAVVSSEEERRKDNPMDAAMRDKRDGNGCVRTLRYILNCRKALFACGTYL